MQQQKKARRRTTKDDVDISNKAHEIRQGPSILFENSMLPFCGGFLLVCKVK